jgi:hypothetical protein
LLDVFFRATRPASTVPGRQEGTGAPPGAPGVHSELEDVMVRHWKIAAAAASVMLLPVVSGVVNAEALMPPYQVPDYQVICTEGVKKLDMGIDVIGASPSKIEAARAASASAKKEMAAGNWYPCSVAVRKGLDALDAG